MPFEHAAFLYRLASDPVHEERFLICFRDVTTELFSSVDSATHLDRLRANGMEEIVQCVRKERWPLLEAIQDYQQLRKPLFHYKTEPSRN